MALVCLEAIQGHIHTSVFMYVNWGWEKHHPRTEGSTELGSMQRSIRSRPYFFTSVLVFIRLLTSC